MTSTYIFKVTLRNDTQVFLISHPPFFNLLKSYQIQILLMLTWLHQFKTIPREHQMFSRFMRIDCCFLNFSNYSFKLISRYQYLLLHFTDFKFHCLKTLQDNSFKSTDSHISYVKQSSTELSPQINNTPEKSNSTELSGAPAIEHITFSSVAPTHYNPFELLWVWNNYLLWVWKARLHSPTQFKRHKLASQPIQHTRKSGGRTPMTITAPHRRSSPNCLLFRRLRWTLVQSRAGKHHIRQLKTIPFNQTRNQGESFSYHQARLLHRRLASWSKKELWNVFSKTGECLSTSAKPADRLSLQERTFPDPPETEIDFTNTKLYVLFVNYSYSRYLIRSIFTSRHFIQSAYNRCVSSTLHSTELIHIGTELLRNKTNIHPKQCRYFNLF